MYDVSGADGPSMGGGYSQDQVQRMMPLIKRLQQLGLMQMQTAGNPNTAGDLSQVMEHWAGPQQDWQQQLNQDAMHPFLKEMSALQNDPVGDLGHTLMTKYGQYGTGGGSPSPQTDSRGQVAGPGPDPTDQLLNQLLQQVLTGGATGSLDYEQQQQDAAEAIRGAYGAQIDSLRHANKRDRRYAHHAEGQVQDMYEALGRSYERTAGREEKQTNREARAMSRLGDRTANQIEESGSNAQARQTALMRKLGVEDAAPDIIAPQNKQLVRDISGVQRESRGDVAFTRQMGEAQGNYLSRGADMSRLEGTNAAADIIRALGPQLGARRDQIAQLLGQQGLDIVNSNNAIASSAAELQQQSQSDVIPQVLSILGFMSDRQDTQHDNSVQDYLAQLTGQKTMSELQGGQGQDSLRSLLPQNLQDSYGILDHIKDKEQRAQAYTVLKSLLASNEMQSGQWMGPIDPESLLHGNQPDTFQMTPERAAAQAEAIARQQFPDMPEEWYNMIRLAAMTAGS